MDRRDRVDNWILVVIIVLVVFFSFLVGIFLGIEAAFKYKERQSDYGQED